MTITKYLSAALLTVLAASCSEGLMDDINKNNGQPAAGTVDAKFSITGIIMNTAFQTVSGDYAFYTSSYTEQEFGTGNNQLATVETRGKSETASSSTFDNVWNSTYTTLRAVKEVEEKCAEGGLNEGQSDVLGVAQVLKVMNWAILTDMHGDIPYSEALQGQDCLNPKLDSQETIYADLQTTLDAAIENLSNATTDHLGSQDLLFNGDSQSWIGLAYALKARLALHTQFRDANAFTKALEYANAAKDAGFTGAELTTFDSNNYNPWTEYFVDRLYVGCSSTVTNLMEERNDPREDIYVCPYFGSNDVPNPGDATYARITETLPAPSWLYNETCSIHMFSYSELEFIIAECKARLGQDASADMAEGIRASFADFQTSDGGVLGVTFTNDQIEEYIAALPVTLNEIMVQKYLSQIRDEQVEAYNDIRRAKANGEEFVKMTNPNNNGSTGNLWPLRLPYGNSDVRSNPNIRDAFGLGNDAGEYIFTENVWWAGGSR